MTDQSGVWVSKEYAERKRAGLNRRVRCKDRINAMAVKILTFIGFIWGFI